MEQDKIWDYFQNEGLAIRGLPEKRQRFVLKYLESGQKVLNIGVGGGVLERLSLEKKVDIHSLDPSEGAIQRLRDELGLGEKAQKGYAQNIPFPDADFDVVVMAEVLEHFDDQILEAALAEVLRVLRPAGKLFVTVPFREKLNEKMAVCPDCGKVFHRIGHVQSFDKPRLRKILVDAGYEEPTMWVSTFVDWHRGGLRNFLKSIIRVTLARLGEAIADPHLIAIANKPLLKQ